MTYYVIGFDPSIDNFLFFEFVLFLCSFVGTSFGFFIGCVFDSYGAASAVTGIVINIPMMFSGIFANVPAMPGYLRWISFISIF